MTIGQLAKKFDLSRSSLLYYDKIGLLTPSERSVSNYRLYSDDDVRKLEKICLYRKTGVTLEKIRSLLSSGEQSIWEERLSQLNDEMNSIRLQQKMILEIIDNPHVKEVKTLFTAGRFSRLLKSTGMTEEEMDLFHVKMELSSSDEHRNFLYFLGSIFFNI